MSRSSSRNYEFLRNINRGAFGTVDLCKQVTDGKLLVVKKISILQMPQEELKAAQNEVHILSSLQHPNVIEYFDSYLESDVLGIVMAYARGGTLSDFLARKNGKLLVENEVLYFFSQCVLGLNYIHSKDILHRDLKTTNIFLQPMGTDTVIKIGDFGVAKCLLGSSHATTMLGTSYYLSPEICEGHPYDKSSDIWALGCVLYELMALKKLFGGHSIGTVVKRILAGQIPPVDGNQYGPLLRTLLNSMLNLDSSLRPTTCMIMAHSAVAPALYSLMVNLGRITPTAMPVK